MSIENAPWLQQPFTHLVDRANAGTLPHGLLFSGPAGLGKHAVAEQFANWLLCDGKEKPCGTCSACQQFKANSHPDISLVGPLEGKQAIAIDQVRELSATLQQTAMRGGWKVAILDPAEAMTQGAANALLKTLEEPTAGSLLILVSKNPARLPATIRSRCQVLRFSAPSRELAARWLGQSNSSDVTVALNHCAGAPFAAKQLLEEGFIDKRRAWIRQLGEIQRGQADPLVVAENWLDDRHLALPWLRGWVQDMLRLMQVSADVQRLTNLDSIQDLQTAVERIHLISLHKYLVVLGVGIRLLETTANPQLLLESLLIPWADGMDEKIIERLA